MKQLVLILMRRCACVALAALLHHPLRAGSITDGPIATNACPRLDVRIDWETFLSRQDAVWELLPEHFDDGAFVGNGTLGMMIYQDGKAGSTVRFDLGRGDVVDHRPVESVADSVGRGRLPIGRFELSPVGRIQKGTLRIDLWNAEVTGSVQTDKGTISFRALCHARRPVILVELKCSEGESGFQWKWISEESRTPTTSAPPDYQPNPPSRMETFDGASVCIQPTLHGGQYATAFVEQQATDGTKRCFISVAISFPGDEAAKSSVDSVLNAAANPIDDFVGMHRAWWHDFYPASFVSVPDSRIESFYWIQMYKLGSATRSDGVPMDCLGPWFRATNWGMWWWDYNIQTAYSPVYASNHLDLGESLTKLMDRNFENFILNVKPEYRADSAGVNAHSGLDGRSSINHQSEYNMVGCLPYACHNYWLQYRYSMDTEVLKRLFPLLKRAVNFYRHILVEGDDGKWNLPSTMSPEYGVTRNANFDLALLRWGCKTLITSSDILKLEDPMVPEWRKILDQLVDFPRDENGFMIGQDLPVLASHRHWSHLFNIYPLFLVNWDQEENRGLLQKSVHHWIHADMGPGMETIKDFSESLTPPNRISYKNGLGYLSPWSWAAAASMYSSFGDGDKALSSMERYLDSPNLHPNTMYTEGFPVLESGLVGATALQDMLLQSWGGKIRIFPGIPSNWKEAVFHDLRAEGAFLVSAQYQDGTIRWARIKSLAGAPCKVAGIVGADFTFVSTQTDASCRKLDSGDLEITIPQGGKAFLFNGPILASPQIQPLASASECLNHYGRKIPQRDPANFEIDDGDPECTLFGDWQTSSIAARGTSATRYISVKNEGAVQWRPTIQQAGNYKVLQSRS